jgi:hypothetical protein
MFRLEKKIEEILPLLGKKRNEASMAKMQPKESPGTC